MSTDAEKVLLLLQVPPPLPVNGVVNPTHTLEAPLIGPGTALTVVATDVKQPVASV